MLTILKQLEDITLEKAVAFGTIMAKGDEVMKRLVAIIILLGLLLAGCVNNDWEDGIPSFPELTIPGATEETMPTYITEPELS